MPGRRCAMEWGVGSRGTQDRAGRQRLNVSGKRRRLLADRKLTWRLCSSAIWRSSSRHRARSAAAKQDAGSGSPAAARGTAAGAGAAAGGGTAAGAGAATGAAAGTAAAGAAKPSASSALRILRACSLVQPSSEIKSSSVRVARSAVGGRRKSGAAAGIEQPSGDCGTHLLLHVTSSLAPLTHPSH